MTSCLPHSSIFCRKKILLFVYYLIMQVCMWRRRILCKERADSATWRGCFGRWVYWNTSPPAHCLMQVCSERQRWKLLWCAQSNREDSNFEWRKYHGRKPYQNQVGTVLRKEMQWDGYNLKTLQAVSKTLQGIERFCACWGSEEFRPCGKHGILRWKCPPKLEVEASFRGTPILDGWCQSAELAIVAHLSWTPHWHACCLKDAQVAVASHDSDRKAKGQKAACTLRGLLLYPWTVFWFRALIEAENAPCWPSPPFLHKSLKHDSFYGDPQTQTRRERWNRQTKPNIFTFSLRLRCSAPAGIPALSVPCRFRSPDDCQRIQ